MTMATSPHMYDSVTPSNPQRAMNPIYPQPPKPASRPAMANSELTELTSTEISLDLQGLIDDTHFADDTANLFSDLVEAKKTELNNAAAFGLNSPAHSTSGHSSPTNSQLMPYNGYRPNVGYVANNNCVNNYGSNRRQLTSGVKQEPIESSYSRLTNASSNNNFYNSGNTADFNSKSLAKTLATPKYLLSSKKRMDRNSDEYRRRRERNNVAVRKSREKAKARTRETEERVRILARDNERLQKKVELLQEELGVLRSLFANVGVLPDHVHRELAKHVDNFQQQHNAMACM